MPGISSPDVGNYAIGKGFILFKPDDAAAFYHVGNVPLFQLTPKVETLEHFSSMAGTKENDQTIVLSKGGDIKMDMEEITARNIALLVLGEVDLTDPAAPVVQILSRSSIGGALQFYGTNEVGPRWKVDAKRVEFIPSGAFDPIGDKYQTLSVTGSMKSVDGSFGTLTLLPNIDLVAPTNILVPYIAGQTSPGSDPLEAQVGETLTAIIGAWTGADSFTYQWKRGGVDISGADSKSYVLASGDSGSTYSVTVTATNDIGSTALTTAATASVT